MLAWRLTTRLLGLASTLILVRLLAPADFGLIALASAFAVTLETALTIGLEAQIARARTTSRALYDTAFTMNLIRGGLLALLIAIGAAPMAGFLGEPRLEPVILALALVPLLTGAANIGTADFVRHIEFGREFLMLVPPRLLQVAVTIGLAFLLQSHWALVIGILVGRGATTVSSYLVHPYRPRLSLAAWRELLGVSWWTWLLSVAQVLRDRTDTFVIARVLGVEKVGLYTVSLEIAALAASEAVNPITRATTAGFAASHRTDADVAEPFLRVLALTALIALPASVGLSLAAGPVVALALGPAWAAAVPLVVAFGLKYAVISLGLVSHSLLFAAGRLRTLLVVTLISAVTRVALLLVLAGWLGLIGIALAVTAVVVVEQASLVGIALRAARGSPGALARMLARPVLASVAMALVLWALGLGWAGMPDGGLAAARDLALAALVGALTYGGVLFGGWWLAGRPSGAEADVLGLARRGRDAALARLRRR